MRPTHQRARDCNDFPGAELWVRIMRPASTRAPSSMTERGTPGRGPKRELTGYLTNLIAAGGQVVMVSANSVELLARGPEDFCVDPPLIAFADWVASERARLAAEKQNAA